VRLLTVTCFIASLAMGYLEHGDRQSALALSVVEWSQRIGIPLWAIAAIGAVGFMMMAMILGTQDTSADRPVSARPQRHPSASDRPPLRAAITSPPPAPLAADQTVDPQDPDWRAKVRTLAQELELGQGARITLDLGATSPIILILEHMAPGRAKRSIATIGTLIAAIPTPPRLKVVFDHCPKAGAPRHHQVSGALAQALDRGQYRVVSHVDEVDVIFHHPHPAWSAPVLNT